MILLTASSASWLVAHAGERGRVLHRADADDRALARHQPRHGVHRADAARVGQRDRGAGVVVHGQLVAPGPPDDVLVRLPELAEVHLLGALDADGTTRVREPSGLARSIAMPRLTCSGLTSAGLPSTSAKELFISGCVGERLDQRVADEVGEADLAAAAAGEVVVDHDAVVDQQLRRHRAHAGRGRHLQRGVHVLHDAGGDAAQRGGLGALGGPCRSAAASRPAWPAAGLAGAGCGGAGAAAGAAGGGRRRSASPGPAAAARPGRRCRPWPRRRSRSAAVASSRRDARPARRRRAGSRRRSRARPGRRWPGRRGSAGTCPRRSTRSGRSPPVGCPARSCWVDTAGIASFTHACQPRRFVTRTEGFGVQATPSAPAPRRVDRRRDGRVALAHEMSALRVIKVPTHAGDHARSRSGRPRRPSCGGLPGQLGRRRS